VRSGGVIFHPRLEVAGHYDSNFFRESNLEFTAPRDPVWMIDAKGRLKLANRSPTRFGASLEVGAAYRELFDADPVDASQHGDRQLEARSGLNTVDGRVAFSIMPKSAFSIGLEAKGAYSDEPASDLLFDDGFERFDFEGGPDFVFRPGEKPGRGALELRLGYRFSMLRYLDDTPALGTSRAQKDTHKILLKTRWNFFPKTAALLDVQFHATNYPQVTDLQAGSSRESPDKDLNPLRLTAGLKGLLSNRLSATVRAGFANSFNAAGQSYQGFIGRFELEYTLEPMLRIAAVYERSVDDDGYANFYTLDRASLIGTLDLPVGLHIEARVGFDRLDYSEDGAPGYVVVDRIEPILLVGAEVGWHLVDWFSVVGAWKLEDNRTDFCYRLDLAPTPCPANPDANQARQIDRADYTRQLVSFILRLSY